MSWHEPCIWPSWPRVLRSSVVRASDRCTEDHMFNSCRGLRFFLCPQLAHDMLITLFLMDSTVICDVTERDQLFSRPHFPRLHADNGARENPWGLGWSITWQDATEPAFFFFNYNRWCPWCRIHTQSPVYLWAAYGHGTNARDRLAPYPVFCSGRKR